MVSLVLGRLPKPKNKYAYESPPRSISSISIQQNAGRPFSGYTNIKTDGVSPIIFLLKY